MKVIVILTILFSSLLLPFPAFAQNGSCRTTTNGFVDWKTCLEGGQKIPNTNSVVKINTPVFINSAYDKFYENAKSPAWCGPSSLNNGTITVEECATRYLLSKFALDIFVIVLGVMVLIFSFLIFRSRLMYITAGDNEDQVKKSKKMATAAFIGFLMIFLGLIIGEILAISIGSSLWDFKLFG